MLFIQLLLLFRQFSSGAMLLIEIATFLVLLIGAIFFRRGKIASCLCAFGLLYVSLCIIGNPAFSDLLIGLATIVHDMFL